ncbi:hypothetical protein KR009_010831, partial [Drosophila setifemur]
LGMITQILMWLALADLLSANQFPQLDERIIGGQILSIDIVPWMVSLRTNEKHICGGVIHSKRIVLTAAHCLFKRDDKDLYVRAGSSFRDFDGQVIKVAKRSWHKDFETSFPSMDIGVLLLRTPLRLGDRVKPIVLADKTPDSGTNVLVTGWGNTHLYYDKNTILLEGAKVQIVDRIQCARAYYDMLTDEMVCAGAAGKDACSGDSGGPLVNLDNGQLVGIVSFGVICSHPYYPGVYADVALLRTWIEDTVKALQSKEKRIKG